MEAYCFKCRAKREIKDPQQVTLKNGRPATPRLLPSVQHQSLPHRQGIEETRNPSGL